MLDLTSRPSTRPSRDNLERETRSSPDEMKVAVVILPVWSVKTAPLGAASVATALREAGHTVDVFDVNAELWRSAGDDDEALWMDGNSLYWEGRQQDFVEHALPRVEARLSALVSALLDGDYGAIGFSVYSTSAYTTRVVVDRIRAATRRAPRLFIGGPYVQPDLVSVAFSPGSVDAAVLGEGEATAVELLASWESGGATDGVAGLLLADGDERWVQTTQREPIPPDELPIPDWGPFEPRGYRGLELPLMMSRGCVAACAFCCENDIWGPFRMRSPDHIFTEIERGVSRHGIHSFYLSDSLLNGDHEKLEGLCDRIIGSGIPIFWGGYARIDRRLTPELLQKMHEAGCHSVIFGLESGSDAVLRSMRKGFTAAQASTTIRDTHAAEIRVDLSMLVGFPGETEADFQQTLTFLGEHGSLLGCVSTGQTCGLPPGSLLYRDPARFGLVTDADGLAMWDQDSGWYLSDGSSTIHVRRARLTRMRQFLDERGIERAPRT